MEIFFFYINGNKVRIEEVNKSYEQSVKYYSLMVTCTRLVLASRAFVLSSKLVWTLKCSFMLSKPDDASEICYFLTVPLRAIRLTFVALS